MFSWQLDDELALLFLQPDMASELFRLCQRNRDYLSQWLPWVPHIQQPSDSAAFIRHAIEKFARGEGLTTAIEYQGEVVSSVTTRSIRGWPRSASATGWRSAGRAMASSPGPVRP